MSEFEQADLCFPEFPFLCVSGQGGPEETFFVKNLKGKVKQRQVYSS